MRIFRTDIRYALRVFRKSPSFVLVVVATLALGIGANTAIFSLMNAVLFKPLPVRHAQELVVVGDPTVVHLRTMNHPPHTDLFSYRLYTELRDADDVFSDMLASCELNRMRVSRHHDHQESIIADQSIGVLVTGNYFSTLGVNAFAGRTLTAADDDKSGAHPVVVVSYGFWKEKLAQDPSLIGSTILLNGFPFTIVGIAEPGFFGDTVGDHQDFWFPVTMAAAVVHGRELLKGYGNSWFHLLARLKPGVSQGQAAANLNIIFRRLLQGELGTQTQFISKEVLFNLRIEVSDGSRGFSELRGRYQQPLFLLMGIVGLVLLIACVNVANLLLARALARRREVSVRLALGAGAWRVVRQLLTENLLLAFAGGAASLLVARWGTSVLLTMSHATDTEVHLDARVLGATAFLCILTGLLFGLVPALRAVDVAIASTLKSRSDATAGSTPHSWNWGKFLVAGQVALSILVLFLGVLFVRSMKNLRNLNLGLDRANLLMLGTDQISAGYTSVVQRVQYSEEIARRLSVLPGVRAVTYSQNGLYYGEAADTIKIDGFIAKSTEDWLCVTDRVGPGYFHTLGISVVAGRELTVQDSASAPKVTVINEALAQFYFGSVSPIGRTLWITDTDDGKPVPFQIVGVVANAKDHALRGQPGHRFYVTIAQSLDAVGNMYFLVRTASNADLLVPPARAVIHDFNTAIPIINVSTLAARIDNSIRSEILVASLSSAFGLLALSLACIGLYGVISYIVHGKTRSIGVHMALGAQRRDVLWMILREAFILVILGMATGIPIALLCGRLLSSSLYGISGSDPSSLSAITLLLAAVASLAAFLPARRAMNVDPIVALREE